MATVIETVNLIMSDVTENNNKFWDGILHDNGDVLCKWGRVGDSGQSKMFPSVGKSFLDKKVREKTAKGYRKNTLIQSGATLMKNVTSTSSSIEIREIAKKQIQSNNPLVTKLIERLAKENAHNIAGATGGKITYNDTTGLFSTPLGIIGQESIDKANDVLIEIGDLVSKQQYDSKMNSLTNDYLMLVPSDIGHRRLDVREFWRDLSKVQQQKQIVDSLQASLASATSAPKVKDVQVDEPKIFDCQLNLVEDGKVIDTIRKFYNKTRQKIHSSYNLDVKTVYSVEINTVKSAFEKHGAKMSNVMTLFHGTRISNVLSILKAGLIIPPRSSPHVCGRLYGDGLYFSDQSTKSLNYATGGVWHNGSRDSNCFMFLCSVGMGNMYKPNRNNYQSINYPVRGYDSTFAEAGSGVMNNEMIVYKTSQCNLVNLIEFSPNGK